MSKRNLVHIEIPTKDAGESAAFYEKLFDWKITRDDGMDYTLWMPDETPGGGFVKTEWGAKPGEVLIYIDSDDIEADLEKAVALGGTLVKEKAEIPNVGWFGVFKDPTGNSIALYTDIHSQSE